LNNSINNTQQSFHGNYEPVTNNYMKLKEEVKEEKSVDTMKKQFT